MMKISLLPCAMLLSSMALLLSLVDVAVAQDVPASAAEPILSRGPVFVEKTGEDLYRNVCQACHMVDGKGAAGAGNYPALVNNKALEAGGYPLSIIVRGSKGMPPVGAMMSNEQVAAVVNYVRTHFGNNYSDAVTANDVAQARP